jgi:hypothetical protein
MVDITNRLPMQEDVEITTEQTATKPKEELAAVSKEKPLEQETIANEGESSVRFLRSRRSLNTNTLRDQLSARLQPMPASERDQVKAELTTKFPIFAALPAATQNVIVDLYVSNPGLSIDSALLLIQLVQTSSFQHLGTADRQLLLKLFASLIESPEFNNTTDGRLMRLITDIANGVIDLRLYRSTGGERGQCDAAGIALNLGSSEVASAIATALKGDCSQLSAILKGLSRAIPDARVEDPLWQMLETHPEFHSLGETRNGVYQALKQFPEADPERLIDHAAFPSRNFVKETAIDRGNELKVIAAIDVAGGGGEATGLHEQNSVERLLRGDIPIKLYRAGDGKKSAIENDTIKLNLSDPGVQRSLSTDGKLVAAAIARLGAMAVKELDKQVAEIDSSYGLKKFDLVTKSMIASALNEYPDAQIQDLARFAESPSFAAMMSKGGRERAHAMRFIAFVLHQVASDPKRLMLAYNALNRLFNNDTQFLGFLDSAAYSAEGEGSGILIDSKQWLEDDMDGMATLVAEVSQALHNPHGTEWGGTISLFAGEYRSAYTEELFRTNEPPGVDHMRQVMNGLFNSHPSSVYAHLRHTYETDEVFAQMVDWIYEKLDEDRVPAPEELRQILLGMAGKTPNLSSTESFEDPWIIDNELLLNHKDTKITKV